jgi:hypothetical protein
MEFRLPRLQLLLPHTRPSSAQTPYDQRHHRWDLRFNMPIIALPWWSILIRPNQNRRSSRAKNNPPNQLPIRRTHLLCHLYSLQGPFLTKFLSSLFPVFLALISRCLSLLRLRTFCLRPRLSPFPLLSTVTRRVTPSAPSAWSSPWSTSSTVPRTLSPGHTGPRGPTAPI